MRNDTSLMGTLQSLLGDDFNLSLFVSIIRKSIIWILLLLLLAAGFVVLYLRYTPPVYEANSTLMLKTEKTAQILGVNQLLSDDDGEVLREVQLAKSRFLIERAINSLPLEVSYFKEGRTKFVSTELYNVNPFDVTVNKVNDPLVYETDIYLDIQDSKTFKLKYILGNQVVEETMSFDRYFESSTKAFEIKLTLKPETIKHIGQHIHQVYFFRINNLSTYSEFVMSRISVAPLDPATKTIQISYKDNNKSKVVDVVNALTDQFKQYDIERKTQSANQILAFLAFQIDTFSKQLSDFQDSLKQFRLENNYLDPQSEIANLVGKVNDLETQKTKLNLDTKMVDWFYDYVEKLKDLRMVSSGLGSDELGDYNTLIQKLRDLEDQRSNMLLKVTPEHPKVKLIDEQIGEVRNDLVNNINNILKRLDFQKENVSSQYSEYMSRILELPEKEADYMRLDRKYKSKENFYLNLLDKQAEYSIARAGIVSDYIILKRAELPKKATSPDKYLLWLIAISLALVLGVVIIVVRFLLHNTIISVEDISRRTKAAVLGMIPTVYSDIPVSSIVVTNNPKSIVSEALRAVRANLQFINTDPGPKTIGVTSTISGEGKTFFAINFGAILSFLNKKVIIIDLDMRRPRLSKIFNVPNDKGMSTILIGKNTIEDCLHSTELDNMTFITSGPIPPNPAELILSDKLKETVEELKKHYDYIIFDTPPLGLVTDGLDVIKNVNFPIYIFRADYSSKAFIDNLDKLIDDNKITNLSVILNDVGRGVSGYYYGYGGYGYSYGYGYGFGYYSDETKPERSFWGKLFKRT